MTLCPDFPSEQRYDAFFVHAAFRPPHSKHFAAVSLQHLRTLHEFRGLVFFFLLFSDLRFLAQTRYVLDDPSLQRFRPAPDVLADLLCVKRDGEPYLLGEDGDVLVERVRGADVRSGRAALSRRAGGQFTFFKNQCEQRE